MEGMQDIGLMASSSAISSLATAAAIIWKTRKPRKIEPSPLGIDGTVEKKQPYITVGECNRRMCEMGARVDRVADGQQKILDKLDEMDSRSERRAKETHDRIDPLVKELAKNIGQVEFIKESFIQATMGGSK